MHTSARLLLLVGCIALGALAGTRAKESAGAVPTAATDGVALNGAVGCRISIRVVDGGTINGGTLALYYYDANLGWVRSASALDCALEANKAADGGAPSAQACADVEPLARFGRLAAVALNVTGSDGGTPNGFAAGGGQTVAPVVRVECFDPSLP